MKNPLNSSGSDARRFSWAINHITGFKRSMLWALVSTLPGMLATILIVTLSKSFDRLEAVTILVAVFCFWSLSLMTLYFSAKRPWQQVANMLLAFREQDFSIRAHVADSDDVIDIVLNELNTISESLSDSRSAKIETQNLLAKILREMDVAFFIFDQNDRCKIANRFASTLYGQPSESLVGRSVTELNLNFAKMALPGSTHTHSFPRRSSRWLVKHSPYRQDGLPLRVFFIADIGENLRQEELDAWRKLIRILTHEINNTLTPLATSVGSMQRIIKRTTATHESLDDWHQELGDTFDIIDDRIHHLGRLVDSYGGLARQPDPQLAAVNLVEVTRHLADTHAAAVELSNTSENGVAMLDVSMFEQVLTNLLNNAAESASLAAENTSGTAETGGPIRVEIFERGHRIVVTVSDHGLGIENPDNLFVPFFSTKESGNGIGLVIARQIIEAHRGTLTLENHPNHHGALATITLPKGHL